MREQKRWVTVVLLLALVGIFVVSFALGNRPFGDEETFAGTDSVVTGILEEDHGVTPWFIPVFEPGSGEIESGLFALQAALGAGILGYALGNLRGRSVAKAEDVTVEVGARAGQDDPSDAAS